MIAKPLRGSLLLALAGAVLAGAIALKPRASSRVLKSVEPNTSEAPSFAGEGQRCTGVNGQAADDPACMKPWRKNQERFVGPDAWRATQRAAPRARDYDAQRFSLSPDEKAEAAKRCRTDGLT